MKTTTATQPAPDEPQFERVISHRMRSVISVLLLCVGLIMLPVAAVASWANTNVLNTDRFVAQYGPLVKDRAVQQYLTDQVSQVIQESIDLDSVATDLFAGIESLNLPPRAAAALPLLKGPLLQGTRSLIRTITERAITSDAFATIWSESLRLSHSQIIGALSGDTTQALSINSSGEVGLQLGPVVATVKQQLIDQGVSIASAIPDVDRVVPLAQVDALGQARVYFNLLTGLSVVAPLIVLFTLLGAVVLARKRARMALWTGVAVAAFGGLLLGGLSIAQTIALSKLTPDPLPTAVATLLLGASLGALEQLSIALVTLGLVTGVVAYLSGPFRVPAMLRSVTDSGLARLRKSAESHGVTTGAFGTQLYRLRALTRALIIAGVIAALLMLRPLTGSVIVWTVFIGVIVFVLLELLQRPDLQDPGSSDGSEPVEEIDPDDGSEPSEDVEMTETSKDVESSDAAEPSEDAEPSGRTAKSKADEKVS